MEHEERRLRQLEQSVRSAIPALYGRLSDNDLVQRAQGGDSRALDALIARHASLVSRLAANLLDDIEDARDATQESLLKLSLRLRQFRGEAQFTTWLHRLVTNTCRDVARGAARRRSEPLGDHVEQERAFDTDPTRLAALADLRRDIADQLGRLSPDQRQLVIMRDALGLSYEEIARLARIPIGTAKCYVHRGRQRLRLGLEGYAPA
ncbi:MAG: RNA polymerase sigma factor [Gaiellales bacterium]